MAAGTQLPSLRTPTGVKQSRMALVKCMESLSSWKPQLDAPEYALSAEWADRGRFLSVSIYLLSR